MELWLRCAEEVRPADTPMGPVPLWLLGYVEKSDEQLRCMIHLGRSPSDEEIQAAQRRTIEECETAVRMLRTGDFFAEGVFGEYTASCASKKGSYAPKREVFNSSIYDEMSELAKFSAMGSKVAEDMLEARALWFQGEEYLRSQEYALSVEAFAQSLRYSNRNADSFSGYFRLGDHSSGFDPAYSVAIDRAPTAANASRGMFHHMLLLKMNRIDDSLAVLNDLIRDDAPNDADVRYLRSLVHGNMGDFERCLEDIDVCIRLVPTEPIYYFWRGVCLRNLIDHSETGTRTTIRKAEEALRHFISIAMPEGRKVCQAWFDLALMHTLSQRGHEPGSEEFKIELGQLIENGFDAEQQMLPVLLRKHESGEPSAAKAMCQTVRAMLRDSESGRTPPLLPSPLVTKRRNRANLAFKESRYEEAVHQYDTLMEVVDEQSSIKILSNRSAAYAKLQEYSAAERDALEVVSLAPEWVKGYIRLARCRLLRRDAKSAGLAVEAGLARVLPGDAKLLLEIEREVQVALAEVVPTPAVVACTLPCWEKVQYQGSVVIVDASGRGDYVSLREAICTAKTETSIIVLAGSYCMRWPTRLDQGKLDTDELNFKLQIIGEGDVSVQAESGSECASLLMAAGEGSCLSLENMTLRNPRAGNRDNGGLSHCASAFEGATVRLVKCKLWSSGNTAAMVATGKGSKLVVSECEIDGSSGGALVERYAFLSAEQSMFKGKSKLLKVEVREGGRCHLSHCLLAGSEKQGLCLYLGGLEATLNDCVVNACGTCGPAGAAGACAHRKRLLTLNHRIYIGSLFLIMCGRLAIFI